MKTILRTLLWTLLFLPLAQAQDLPYSSGSTGADGAFMVPTVPGIDGIYGFGAAYDASDAVIRVYAGIYLPNIASLGSPGVRTTVWDWNGTNWVNRGSHTGSGRYRDIAMAYDPQNQEVIVQGGRNTSGSTVSSSTVRWTGSTMAAYSGAAEAGSRSIHCMDYDQDAEELIVYGGFNGAAPIDTTYAWIASNTTWVAKSPATPPPARYYHKFCWDGARNEMVMFGGYNGGPIGGTFVYSGGEWTEKFPTNTPADRYLHAMAYDPVSQKTILYGGITESDTSYNGETWLWDGTNWTEVTSTTAALSPRYGSEMVTDTDKNEVYLIGGLDNRYGQRGDMWKWDPANTNWVQVSGGRYTIDMSDNVDGVYNYTSINVKPGITVDFAKNNANSPVVWLATDDVIIDGNVSVNGEWGVLRRNTISDRPQGGPGGFAGGVGGTRTEVYNTLSGTPGEGPGGGAPGITSGGGATGRYQGFYGNEYIIPLLGGSGGGGGAAVGAISGGNGGAGGGVLLIASSRDITVNGIISADGGFLGRNPSYNGNAGGHGSGGAVKLVSDRLYGTGQILARNGGGGVTANTGGYVRLESYLRPFDISGDVTAGVRSNAAPLSGVNYGLVPSLVVSAVDGAGVSNPPTGEFSSPDVVFSSAGPVNITVTATNIPDTTPVTLSIYHSAGTINLTPVNLSGGTAVFSETIPQGFGTIQAFATYDVTP